MSILGTRVRFFVYAVACVVVFGGCATSIITNERLDQFDPGYGYRARNVEAVGANSDSLLVILTFSGGGTRAAAFAYGVLEQLRDTRVVWEGQDRSLLDEVDVISSVSGGSLPAAYYALFGARIFEEFPEKVLYENIQGSLIKRVLLPPDNLKMLSPLYTRTDILAENFDDDIFEHKTYNDLLETGRRPYLIINSTDISTGYRFEFTQDQFDQIYSDLGPYHIGHAVAASACFPGAFPPIMLRNYERGDDYILPDWAQRALNKGDIDAMAYRQARNLERYGESGRYIHLSDGGIADNLGLLPVIFLLRREAEGYAIPEDSLYAKAKTILLVTVNAEVKRPSAWDMIQSPVGLFNTLFTAGSIPLSNFTAAQFQYLRLLIENRRLQRQLDEATGNGAAHHPDIHFVEVSFAHVDDQAQRDALNELPTSFKLQRDQVDQLRSTARQILREHPDFQTFISSLR